MMGLNVLPAALLASFLLSAGTYLIVAFRSRRMDLDTFYRLHPIKAFSEVEVREENLLWWETVLEAIKLRRAAFSLVRNKRMRGPVERAGDLCLMAGEDITGEMWILQTVLITLASVGVAVVLAIFSGVMALVLAPVLVAFYQYSSLSRKASKRRSHIQQQLPSILALMAAAAAQIGALEGRGGVMQWIINTVDDDTTALFRDLLREASARRTSLEIVFDEASLRLKIEQLASLAQIFAIYHEAGRGLREQFEQVANDWRLDMERKLEASMGRRNFASMVPMILFNLPALMLIILTPAIINVAHQLFGGG